MLDKLKITNLIKFEIKSLIGRTFLNKKPKLFKNENHLNLGCADHYLDGYVNADFFYNFKPWKKDKRKLEWELDLRYRLNCKNDIFDGIHSEHVLEHLCPNQVLNLLKELLRILKPEGTLRISVPNIEEYINFYIDKIDGDKKIEFEKRYKNGCQAIRSITQDHQHLSVWDFENLSEYLSLAGFREIKKVSFMKGGEKKLLIDLEKRKWETLYIEAKK